jgi:hypothetical protein
MEREVAVRVDSCRGNQSVFLPFGALLPLYPSLRYLSFYETGHNTRFLIYAGNQQSLNLDQPKIGIPNNIFFERTNFYMAVQFTVVIGSVLLLQTRPNEN